MLGAEVLRRLSAPAQADCRSTSSAWSPFHQPQRQPCLSDPPGSNCGCGWRDAISTRRRSAARSPGLLGVCRAGRDTGCGRSRGRPAAVGLGLLDPSGASDDGRGSAGLAAATRRPVVRPGERLAARRQRHPAAAGRPTRAAGEFPALTPDARQPPPDGGARRGLSNVPKDADKDTRRAARYGGHLAWSAGECVKPARSVDTVLDPSPRSAA